MILAHFASGGGWESEIVLVNSGTDPLAVRGDLFKQDGTPFSVTLNGVTGSSFTIANLPELNIPGGGVAVLAPKGPTGDSDF